MIDREIDIAYDCQLSVFFDTLKQAGSPTIVGYTATGPAGGNPRVTLRFNNQDELDTLLELMKS